LNTIASSAKSKDDEKMTERFMDKAIYKDCIAGESCTTEDKTQKFVRYYGLAGGGFNLIFAILWVLSMSWTVALTFFLPLTLCIAVFVAAVLGLLVLVERRIGAIDLEGRGEIVRVPVDSLRGMIGWAGNATEGFDNYFTFPILICIVAMALSPLVIYGTWTMMFIYAGNSTDEVMDLLALEYKHCFAVFLGARFRMPSFDFSLSDAFDAFSAFSDLTSFANFDPSHFMESSSALTALNFLISLIKPLICVISTGFAVFGMTASVAANIPVSIVAAGEADNVTNVVKLILDSQQADGTTTTNGDSPTQKQEGEVAVASSTDVELTV